MLRTFYVISATLLSATLAQDLSTLSPDNLSLLPLTATCQLQSRTSNYSTSGTVTFLQRKDPSNATLVTTEISGRLSGLTPNGKHGFHIHALGNLSDPVNGCLSLGPHYNPLNKTHGAPNSTNHHVGDMGNIQADAQGVADFKIYN